MNRRDKSQDLLICILCENQKNSKTVYRRKYINDHTHIKHPGEKPKFRISDVKNISELFTKNAEAIAHKRNQPSTSASFQVEIEAKQARLSTGESEEQSSSIIANETIKNNDCVKISLVEKNPSVDATPTVEEIVQTTVSRTNAVELRETGAIETSEPPQTLTLDKNDYKQSNVNCQEGRTFFLLLAS